MKRRKASRPKKITRSSGGGRPVILPQEELQLLDDRLDFTGFEYLRARCLRAQRSLKAEDRKFLAEHDAVEARIQSDPKTVLEQAVKGIDDGTMLLLKLIRSRKLRREFPKECQAEPCDEAVEFFTSRLGFMNRQFVRLSEDRAPDACFHLWYQAMDLAEAVVRLCAIFPDEFRSMAESSLLMPSLRAKSPKFSCDAEAIARAIHLAEKHPAPEVHDNRTRIGALCHYLTAKVVAEVESVRREKEHFERMARYNNSENSQDIFLSSLHPDNRANHLECWRLPALHGHADEWWEGRVRKMVRSEFDRMRRNPIRNPALWQELKKVAAHDTDSAKRAALEKYCFNKLEQIAGKPALPASPD